MWNPSLDYSMVLLSRKTQRRGQRLRERRRGLPRAGDIRQPVVDPETGDSPPLSQTPTDDPVGATNDNGPDQDRLSKHVPKPRSPNPATLHSLYRPFREFFI
jgi:hypothetical protein